MMVRIKAAPAETADGSAEKTEGRLTEEPGGRLTRGTEMTLIIGGSHQGKTGYAHSRYAGHPLLDHLQIRVRTDLQHGKTGEDILDGLLDFAGKNPGCVIVCDEVGNGIVPRDAFERKYRDVLGEILMQLSARSSEVIRVFCGIGQVLKKQE